MELTDDVDFDAFVLKQNFQENKGKNKMWKHLIFYIKAIDNIMQIK